MNHLRIALITLLGVASTAHAASFTRLPYTQAATASSVVLRWQQSAGRATVHLTPAGLASLSSLTERTDPPNQSGDHALTFTGLQAGTRYRYVVTARDATGAAVASGEFATAAPAGKPFTFLIYGDNRSSDADHHAVVAAMAREGADFAVNTGDIVSRGTAAEYDNFFAIEAPLLSRGAMFPALGNHERAWDGDANNWIHAFSTPRGGSALRAANDNGLGAERYYSFDWGDARFVVLDFNRLTTAQDRWLEETLADARRRGVLHIFALMHHGPFDSGEHGENGAAHATWVPLFERYGVDLIVSGHDHDYERGLDAKTGLRYVVSGGGGAPIYDVNHKRPYQQRFVATLHYVRVEVSGPRVELAAVRPDGTVIDRLSFSNLAASRGQPAHARSAPAHH